MWYIIAIMPGVFYSFYFFTQNYCYIFLNQQKLKAVQKSTVIYK